MQMATALESDTGEMIVKRVSVPIGLEELMEGLTKEVVMKKPKDIYVFASEYFTQLLNLREKGNYKAIPVKRAQSIVKQTTTTTTTKENIKSFISTKSKSVGPAVKQLSRQISVRSDLLPSKKPSNTSEKNKSFIDKRKALKKASTDNSEKKTTISNEKDAPRSVQSEKSQKTFSRRNRSVTDSNRGTSSEDERAKVGKTTPRRKSQVSAGEKSNKTESKSNRDSSNRKSRELHKDILSIEGNSLPKKINRKSLSSASSKDSISKQDEDEALAGSALVESALIEPVLNVEIIKSSKSDEHSGDDQHMSKITEEVEILKSAEDKPTENEESDKNNHIEIDGNKEKNQTEIKYDDSKRFLHSSNEKTDAPSSVIDTNRESGNKDDKLPLIKIDQNVTEKIDQNQTIGEKVENFLIVEKDNAAEKMNQFQGTLDEEIISNIENKIEPEIVEKGEETKKIVDKKKEDMKTGIEVSLIKPDIIKETTDITEKGIEEQMQSKSEETEEKSISEVHKEEKLEIWNKDENKESEEQTISEKDEQIENRSSKKENPKSIDVEIKDTDKEREVMTVKTEESSVEANTQIPPDKDENHHENIVQSIEEMDSNKMNAVENNIKSKTDELVEKQKEGTDEKQRIEEIGISKEETETVEKEVTDGVVKTDSVEQIKLTEKSVSKEESNKIAEDVANTSKTEKKIASSELIKEDADVKESSVETKNEAVGDEEIKSQKTEDGDTKFIVEKTENKELNGIKEKVSSVVDESNLIKDDVTEVTNEIESVKEAVEDKVDDTKEIVGNISIDDISNEEALKEQKHQAAKILEEIEKTGKTIVPVLLTMQTNAVDTNNENNKNKTPEETVDKFLADNKKINGLKDDKKIKTQSKDTTKLNSSKTKSLSQDQLKIKSATTERNNKEESKMKRVKSEDKFRKKISSNDMMDAKHKKKYEKEKRKKDDKKTDQTHEDSTDAIKTEKSEIIRNGIIPNESKNLLNKKSNTVGEIKKVANKSDEDKIKKLDKHQSFDASKLRTELKEIQDVNKYTTFNSSYNPYKLREVSQDQNMNKKNKFITEVAAILKIQSLWRGYKVRKDRSIISDEKATGDNVKESKDNTKKKTVDDEEVAKILIEHQIVTNQQDEETGENISSADDDDGVKKEEFSDSKPEKDNVEIINKLEAISEKKSAAQDIKKDKPNKELKLTSKDKEGNKQIIDLGKAEIGRESGTDIAQNKEISFQKAALNIQTLWRGFQVRKHRIHGELFGNTIDSTKAISSPLEVLRRNEKDNKKTAALKIQSIWRGYVVRKNIKDVNKRFTELQKPSECDEMPNQRNLTDEDILNAATKIQAGARGHLVRKELQKNKFATISEDQEKSSPDDVNQTKTVSNEEFDETIKQLDKIVVPTGTPDTDSKKKKSNLLYRSITVEEPEIIPKVSSKLTKALSVDSFTPQEEKLKTNSIDDEVSDDENKKIVINDLTDKKNKLDEIKESTEENLTALEKEVKEAIRDIAQNNNVEYENGEKVVNQNLPNTNEVEQNMQHKINENDLNLKQEITEPIELNNIMQSTEKHVNESYKEDNKNNNNETNELNEPKSTNTNKHFGSNILNANNYSDDVPNSLTNNIVYETAPTLQTTSHVENTWSLDNQNAINNEILEKEKINSSNNETEKEIDKNEDTRRPLSIESTTSADSVVTVILNDETVDKKKEDKKEENKTEEELKILQKADILEIAGMTNKNLNSTNKTEMENIKLVEISSEDKEIDINAAATKIQSSYRGYRVRRDLKAMESNDSQRKYIPLGELSNIKEEEEEKLSSVNGTYQNKDNKIIDSDNENMVKTLEIARTIEKKDSEKINVAESIKSESNIEKPNKKSESEIEDKGLLQEKSETIAYPVEEAIIKREECRQFLEYETNFINQNKMVDITKENKIDGDVNVLKVKVEENTGKSNAKEDQIIDNEVKVPDNKTDDIKKIEQGKDKEIATILLKENLELSQNIGNQLKETNTSEVNKLEEDGNLITTDAKQEMDKTLDKTNIQSMTNSESIKVEAGTANIKKDESFPEQLEDSESQDKDDKKLKKDKVYDTSVAASTGNETDVEKNSEFFLENLNDSAGHGKHSKELKQDVIYNTIESKPVEKEIIEKNKSPIEKIDEGKIREKDDKELEKDKILSTTESKHVGENTNIENVKKNESSLEKLSDSSVGHGKDDKECVEKTANIENTEKNKSFFEKIDDIKRPQDENDKKVKTVDAKNSTELKSVEIAIKDTDHTMKKESSIEKFVDNSNSVGKDAEELEKDEIQNITESKADTENVIKNESSLDGKLRDNAINQEKEGKELTKDELQNTIEAKSVGMEVNNDQTKKEDKSFPGKLDIDIEKDSKILEKFEVQNIRTDIKPLETGASFNKIKKEESFSEKSTDIASQDDEKEEVDKKNIQSSSNKNNTNTVRSQVLPSNAQSVSVKSEAKEAELDLLNNEETNDEIEKTTATILDDKKQKFQSQSNEKFETTVVKDTSILVHEEQKNSVETQPVSHKVTESLGNTDLNKHVESDTDFNSINDENVPKIAETDNISGKSIEVDKNISPKLHPSLELEEKNLNDADQKTIKEKGNDNKNHQIPATADNQTNSDEKEMEDFSTNNEQIPASTLIKVDQNLPATINLMHTGEFHDTITVPFPTTAVRSPSNIGNEEHKDSESQTTSPQGLVNTGELHDGVFPLAVQLNQAPAGVEILTSLPSNSISNDDVQDGAQASDKDASTTCKAQSDNISSVPLPVNIMETEKRNNASIHKKSMEAEAATKIQAGFRGYQVRKQLKKIGASGEISKHQRRSARRKSSGRITESGRITQSKPKDTSSDLEEKSAVKIQAGIRGFLVRRRQKKQKQSKESS